MINWEAVIYAASALMFLIGIGPILLEKGIPVAIEAGQRTKRVLIAAGVLKPKQPHDRQSANRTFMCDSCGQIASVNHDTSADDEDVVQLHCEKCFHNTKMDGDVWRNTDRVRDRKIAEAKELLGNVNTDDEVQQAFELLTQAEKDRAANRYECPAVNTH